MRCRRTRAANITTLRGDSEKFRIAHVLPWPTVGGVESATRRIIRAVDFGVFEHSVFHIPGAKQVYQFFGQEDVEIYEYHPLVHSYRHFLTFFRGSLELARQFKASDISLIHCSDLLAGFHAGLAGRLAGVPVLCHIRGISSNLSKRDQSFLRLINHFAFVSADTWRQFGLRVPSEKGTVIYDGFQTANDVSPRIGESVIDGFEAPHNGSVVGMVARVAEAKDYFTLARAAAKVLRTNPNVRFLIVGDNSGTERYRQHYDKVKSFLAEIGISDKFIFVGHRENVEDYLRLMDVFVLSTHSEGLPLVLLEAMAVGVPVISTRIGGIPEIIDHGRTGLLHDHEDADTFADQILDLLENKVLRGTMVAAARNEITTKWTMKRFGDDMSTLYKKLMGLEHANELDMHTPTR